MERINLPIPWVSNRIPHLKQFVYQLYTTDWKLVPATVSVEIQLASRRYLYTLNYCYLVYITITLIFNTVKMH